MSAAGNWHGIAASAAELLIYSAVAGTLLAAAVWLLLQAFPRRDSRTSFTVWFATLLATALLPLLSMHLSGGAGNAAGESRAVVTMSTRWAWCIFGVWAALALCGLARVALATVQVWKLRRQATAVDMQRLHADLRALIEDLQRSRPVRLLVSEHLEVPTAIGFRKPAIILPAWLLESTPPEELKYILLHELAHLWRRDDWTNLAQKVLKALLFFLPSVWWIERRLSLDREIACDDRVLAQTGTPRGYAECLAHVAERSFLRRQLALAQAAVGRVRQLTARVAMILDPNRPRATQLWKPAIPAVIVLAGLSALPASLTPALVSFSDASPKTEVSAAQDISAQNISAQNTGPQNNGISAAPAAVTQHNQAASPGELRAIPAAYRIENSTPRAVKTKTAARGNVYRPHKNAAQQNVAHTAVANNESAPKAAQPEVLAASYQAPKQEEYITVRQELFVVVTEQTASGAQQSWQMHVVEVSLMPVEKPAPKPRKI
jgi:beta-lactamase regulating signal transducer with metallopeptidase domain